MTVRLSTAQIFQQGIDNILAKQADLQKTQEQLASGRRVLNPSDDPIAAVQILDISEDLELLDQYQRNGSTAESQLRLEETVLSDVANVLQRVRELAVQANNATQSVETRNSIATEINARLDELVTLANTRDANGEYIFAGFQGQSQPFNHNNGQVVYNGDDGQRFLQLAAGTQVAVRDSGSQVFLAVPAGNGSFDITPNAANTGTAVVQESTTSGTFIRDSYTVTFNQASPTDPVTYQVTDSTPAVVATGNYVSGEAIEFAGARLAIEGQPADTDSFELNPAPKRDMFSTLQAIADSLTGSGSSPAGVAAVNNAMARGLDNIDQALGRVLEVQADVGVRLNRTENQLNINEDFNLQLQEALSDIQDIDYAEAISRLNLQLTALEAAQKTYISIQGLSLFNFL